MNQDSIIRQQGPLSAPTFTSGAKQPAFQVNYQLVTNWHPVQTPFHCHYSSSAIQNSEQNQFLQKFLILVNIDALVALIWL